MMNLSDCATIIEQMADNGLITNYELTNNHNHKWDPKYILANSKENKTFEFKESDIIQLKDEVELINFLHNGIGSRMNVKPNISNNSNHPIFVSTPSGTNHWKDLMEERPKGLYYRVKDKLADLQGRMETYKYLKRFSFLDKEEEWKYNSFKSADLSLKDILDKFNKTNGISSDDMKLCNKLWAQYEK